MAVFLVKDNPLLKDLDELLRCGICYEYMKTTMVTSCSHNYCSLCIRKYLTYKSKCPACFEEAFDSQLRNNKIVDEFIEIFIRLSNHIQKVLENQQITNLHKTSTNETNNKHNLLDVRKDKKNITEEPLTSNNTPIKKEPVCEPTTSFFVSKISEKEMKGFSTDDDNSDDFNITNSTREGPSKQGSWNTSKVERQIPSMFSPKNANSFKQNVVPPVNLVQCPVCNVDIPDKNINTHLDACLKRSEMAEERSPKQVEKRKPLPKLVYSLLPPKELKKKLKELGLSTQGDQKTLISRHQRYTLLYNCECDSSNPRSIAEIIQQVEREEKEEKKASSLSSVLMIDRKTDPKIIEKAYQNYLKQNKKSFDVLIKGMREREATKKTSVRSNRILSDDEDDDNDKAQNYQTKTPEKQMIDRKSPLRNCIIDFDSDDTEIISDFPNTSDSSKQIVQCSSEHGIEVMDETPIDLDYEPDADQATSPVLGRHVVAVPVKREIEKDCREYRGLELTPDMFETQGVPQNIDADDGSNESFSLLTQVTPDIKPTEAAKDKHSYRNLESQIIDPDYVPDPEDVSQDFEIKKRPSKSKRKAKNTSISFADSPSVGERRSLRKRPKH